MTGALALGKEHAERSWITTVLASLAGGAIILAGLFGILYHKAEVSARAQRPLFVLMLPSGRARIVDFASLDQSAITSVVQGALQSFAIGAFGCKPSTVAEDRIAAWAMLNSDQRAEQQETFKSETAKCSATPMDEVRIVNVIPTIESAVPLKPGPIYKSTIGFEVIHISGGREAKKEFQTVTVHFTIGGQPMANDSGDLQRINPLGIAISAFRAEKET